MDFLTAEKISELLPKRPKDANKGTFGKVLAVAGSKNYPGAAYLSCAASYRIGAGLVTLVTGAEVKAIVSKKLPEVTFLDYGETFNQLKNYDVVLVGPGLGQESAITQFLDKLVKQKLPPMVVDGDGLNFLAKKENWEKLGGEVILTPHPGEMSRLTKLSIQEIQNNREKVAEEFAKKWRKVIVLKGANTIVVSPAGELFLSPFANPALATAGTGDVLSGMIAGFLAQGLNLFNASICVVYVHGLAGEMMADKFGKAGGLASDLLDFIPKALLDISKHRIG